MRTKQTKTPQIQIEHSKFDDAFGNNSLSREMRLIEMLQRYGCERLIEIVGLVRKHRNDRDALKKEISEKFGVTFVQNIHPVKSPVKGH